MSFDWGRIGRGALGGAASGAGIGTLAEPGVGTAIGGLAGGLVGGFSGLFGESEDEIYTRLMQEYTNSPEHAAQLKALSDMKAQADTQGPTAQEKASLDQAMRVANDQFGSSYGSILSNLRARSAAGGGGAAEAALAASEGQARSGGMAQMAEGAAAQEGQRQQQARQAYTQMAMQAQQIGDQYRRWASGRAHGDNMVNEAATAGLLNQAGSAIASGVAGYKQGQKGDLGEKSAVEPSSGVLPGAASSFGTAGSAPGVKAPGSHTDFGMQSWLQQPPLPTGVVQQPNQVPNQMQNPGDPWRERQSERTY